jgi:predicted DNA-binding antitoxin AbrB/MazE fold protein
MNHQIHERMTIHATYENGVFTPRETVNLPEGREVEFEIRTVKEAASLALMISTPFSLSVSIRANMM